MTLAYFKALGKIPCEIDLLKRRVRICVRIGPPSLTRLEVIPYRSPDLLLPKFVTISSISWGRTSVSWGRTPRVKWRS